MFGGLGFDGGPATSDAAEPKASPNRLPFARVTAPCSGDDGIITLRTQRTVRRGTKATARLQQLERRAWVGGIFIDPDPEQPSKRFMAVKHEFHDRTVTNDPWGTDALALYFAGDREATCGVNVNSTPTQIGAGASDISLLARPKAHALRLYASSAIPNDPCDLRVRIRTADGSLVKRSETVRSDAYGSVEHTMRRLRGLDAFTQVAFAANCAGERRQRTWMVLSRGRR